MVLPSAAAGRGAGAATPPGPSEELRIAHTGLAHGPNAVMADPDAVVPLPASQAQVPYATVLAATGGMPPYTWAVTSGGLPPGLSLEPSTGLLSGTPGTAASFAFTATVTDSAGHRASAACSITVAAGTSVGIVRALPGAAIGVPYHVTLAVSGGTPSYTWAVTSGALPPGLACGPSSGTISGTPTTPGTYVFTVSVTDSVRATGSAVLSILVVSTVPPHTELQSTSA